jgi:hypothetical protein
MTAIIQTVLSIIGKAAERANFSCAFKIEE